MSHQQNLTIHDHPGLRQRAIPAGVSANAVVRRKHALLEGGTDPDRAEEMAIEAETNQAKRNADAGVVATDDKSSFLLSEPVDMEAGKAADATA